MILRYGYNTRNKKRWIIITNNSGEPLLSQTFLKYGKRCELNSLAKQYDLDYYVTLKNKDVSKVYPKDYDYLNWAKDFDICFVGYEESLSERLRINERKFFVGN
jgi:hypothetical protein